MGAFPRTLDDDIFTDRETTSRWDFAGRVVDGRAPETGE